MKLYDEKDYVEVVDSDGKPVHGFEHPVPKSWVGTPLLPVGTKAKGGRGKASKAAAPSAGSGKQQSQSPDPSEKFDPSKHNQDEVLAYLADADADEVERVKTAEADDKGRKEIAAFEPAAPSGEDNKTEPEGS